MCIRVTINIVAAVQYLLSLIESTWPSMPSFKINSLWPDFLKTHLRGDSPMDTTLSSRVPGTVVPYVIYLASKNCIKLRAGLSILKIRWYKFSTFLFTIFWTLSQHG